MNTPVKSLSNLLKSSLNRVEREISKNIKDEEKLITLTAGHLIKAKGKKNKASSYFTCIKNAKLQR